MEPAAEGGPPRLRLAVPSDAAAVADLYVRARHHAAPAVPPLVGSDGARAWMTRVVVEGREMWIAETEAGAVVALMLLEGDCVDQLYVDPGWTGRGIGASLVEVAKHVRPGGLQLWTFQSNRRAHRFYERHGFVAVERTDGSGNQERQPDVRYVWHPGGSSDTPRPVRYA